MIVPRYTKLEAETLFEFGYLFNGDLFYCKDVERFASFVNGEMEFINK
jgi:hypothetical protein